MSKNEKLLFDKFEVTINPENLRFDEHTLGTYITREGGFYDNFGHYLSLAERNLQNKESQYEKLYCDRFIEAKEGGSSDKLAEAKAKADADVVSLKDAIFDARYAVNRLKNHLKAWDKNHDNAQSLGHMLRKQMDRLPTDVIYDKHISQSSFEQELNSTVGSFEAQSPVAYDSAFDSGLGLY